MPLAITTHEDARLLHVASAHTRKPIHETMLHHSRSLLDCNTSLWLGFVVQEPDRWPLWPAARYVSHGRSSLYQMVRRKPTCLSQFSPQVNTHSPDNGKQ